MRSLPDWLEPRKWHRSTPAVPPQPSGAPATRPPAVQTEGQSRSRLLAAIFLARVLGFVSRLLLVPFFPALMAQLQVGYTEVGLIFSAYLIGYGAALIPAGAAADRISPRPLVALGVAILAVALPATAYAPIWYVAVGLRVIMGIATALIFSPVQKLVVAYFPAAARGQAFAWQEVAVSVGSLFSLTVAPLLSLHFSMAEIHWVAGLVSAATAFLVLTTPLPAPVVQTPPSRLSPEGPDPASAPASAPTSGPTPAPAPSPLNDQQPSVWVQWRRAGLVILAVEFAVGSWIVSAVYSWLPTYLTEGAGWNSGEAALAMGLLLGLQMLAGLMAGRLVSRVRNRSRLLVMASAVFVACSLILTLGMRGPAVLLYPGVVLLGMVPPFIFVTLFSMSGDRLPARTAGLGLGTLNTVNQITTALSTSFYGWLLDLAGSFPLIWGSAAAVGLVQVGLATATKDSRRQTS